MALKESDIQAMLLEKKLLKKAEIERFISFAKNKGVTLEEELFEREALPDEVIGRLFADLYKVPFAKLSDKTIPEPLLRIVPYNMAAKQSVMPFDQKKDEILVAISNPHNYELLNFIEKKTGFKVTAHYATPKEIKAALKAYNKDVNEKFTKLLAGAMKDPTKN